MPKNSTLTLDEKMQRRKKVIEASNFSRVIDSIGCEETGAGVVISQDTYGMNTMRAHFFRPNSFNKIFKEKPVKSNHERIALMKTLHTIFENERIAKKAPHDLKIGDIVTHVWGVTMQGVNFLKVVNIPSPREIIVVEVPRKYVSGDQHNGTVVPDLDAALSDGHSTGVKYKVSMETGNAEIFLGGRNNRGSKWSGTPVHVYSD